MHHEKMVVAIKTNGKVLREQGETVYLPFGAEYQIHIKNLNSVRALVKVSIDGQDTMENVSGVIVPANGTIDLERFIKNGNLDAGNRFKFIERTEKIEKGPRGIRAEDGLIRVEFEYERVPISVGPIFAGPATTTPLNLQWDTRDNIDWQKWSVTCSTSSNVNISSSLTSAATSRPTKGLRSRSKDDNHVGVPCSATVNDAGITVPGSISDQKFTMTTGFNSDGLKRVIVMKLVGEVVGKKVKKPVTVKTKQRCETCAHMNKWGSKFCSECGTSLQMV